MALKHATRFATAAFGAALAVGATVPNAQAQQEPMVSVAGMAAAPNLQFNPAAAPTPDQMLHLTFALKAIRQAELEEFVASQHDPDSPNYHHWLKPDEVGKFFGAPEADIAAVVQYAHAHHLKTTVWPNHMFISAEGSVAQVQNAFQVVIHGYDRPGGPDAEGLSSSFYAPDRDPKAPASIALRVGGIFGLSSFIQARPIARRFAPQQASGGPEVGRFLGPGSASSGGLGARPQFSQPLQPPEISKVYNFDGLHNLALDGASNTIGVFSPTKTFDADIQTFYSTFFSGTASIQHIQVDGGATDANGQDEASLDAEIIFGQAPKITVAYYESPNNGNLDVWNKIIKDNPAVVSNSWGYVESALHKSGNDSYVASLDALMATMDTQGIAHYNASGDLGADAGGTGVLSVSVPSSSTHVTGVGGTSLFGDANGNYQSESGWSGSGGGLSIYFSRPSWQAGPGVVNSFSNGKRQVPDVSALADGSTPGYLIYTRELVSGSYLIGWYQAGGTSASTPLWAVANQLYNQRLVKLLGAGHRTGVLNTDLYGLGAAYSGQQGFFCYHDVTTGSNGFYSCTNGWDYVTGWGSADFTKLMLDYLENYQAQPLADLAPWTPGSTARGTFTSPVMISKSATNVTEPTTFSTSDTYFFNIGMINNAGGADSLIANNSLQIDGVDNVFAFGPFASGLGHYHALSFTKQFTAGTHTIKLIVNSDGAIKESNTTNNVFTRTITVVGSNALTTVALNPTSVCGGQTAVGKVTLSGPAPTGGAIVTLSSSNTAAATVPASVTVAAGATSKTFLVKTLNVSAQATSSISGTYKGVKQSATLTVQAVALASLSFSPSTIQGGVYATLTVTLSCPAPTGGIVVTLTNTDTTDATVPTSVTVPAGAYSISIPVATNLVNSNATATVTGTYNHVSQSASLTITP